GKAVGSVPGPSARLIGRAPLRRGRKPRGEVRLDLNVAQQKGPLVQALAAEPAGDFAVALAGVAGTAGRGDVGQRVSPAPGQRQHTVPLQWGAGRTAVGAATPRPP